MSTDGSHPKPLLISFSGIDGAGKSTQITNLHNRLTSSGLTVRVIPFWDEVAQLTSLREEVGHKVFRGDRGVGTPEAPIVRRDKNVQSPVLTLFRLGVYLLDAISLKIKIMAACKSKIDVIIFDRFVYDELANLDLDQVAFRVYARVLLRIAPKPDVAFLLDADPQDAFVRKPEYPLQFLHSNRKSYLRLAHIADWITIIPPLPIDAAVAQVTSSVSRVLPVNRRLGHAGH